jgi:hypothetical protein
MTAAEIFADLMTRIDDWKSDPSTTGLAAAQALSMVLGILAAAQDDPKEAIETVIYKLRGIAGEMAKIPIEQRALVGCAALQKMEGG